MPVREVAHDAIVLMEPMINNAECSTHKQSRVYCHDAALFCPLASTFIAAMLVAALFMAATYYS